jgi:hypothetical protein
MRLKFKMSLDNLTTDPFAPARSCEGEMDKTWSAEWSTKKSRKPTLTSATPLLKVDSGIDLAVSTPTQQSQERHVPIRQSRIKHMTKDYDEDGVATTISSIDEEAQKHSRPPTPAQVRWAMRKATVKKPYLPYLMAGEEDGQATSRAEDMPAFLRFAKRECKSLYNHRNFLDTGSAILDDDADLMWEKAPILKPPPWALWTSKVEEHGAIEQEDESLEGELDGMQSEDSADGVLLYSSEEIIAYMATTGLM